MVEPKSLNEIWDDIHSTRFRFRNIRTLEDFMVTGILAWTQARPCHMEVISCDSVLFNRVLVGAHERTYALLSTREEIDFLNSMQLQQATFRVKSAYKRTGNT